MQPSFGAEQLCFGCAWEASRADGKTAETKQSLAAWLLDRGGQPTGNGLSVAPTGEFLARLQAGAALPEHPLDEAQDLKAQRQ